MSSITSTVSPGLAVAPAAPSSGKASATAWIAVGAGMIGAFMAILNIQITNASLLDIEGGIGTGVDNGAWISTSYLIGEIVTKGATSFDQIRTALTEINPEWVEADLRTCPGAMDALKRSSEAVWVPEAVAEPDSDAGYVEIILHADIIEVELRQYARRASYRGWIAEDSPAAWAESLAAVLEPCWSPASVAAPWLKDGP